MATPIVWSSELPVNTTTQGTQNDPGIVALAGGGFVVAWADFSQTGGDTSGGAVRAQLFHADGSKSGNEILVNTLTADSQQEPAVFALPGGGFVVTWRNGQIAAQDSIRAQIFDAYGAPIGGELTASTTATGSQRSPAGTAFANGQFFIAWTDFSGVGDSDGSGIRAHVFNANGSKATPEFQVNSTTPADQSFPAAATLANGRVVVAWTDQSGTGGDTSDNAVRARLFDIDGEPLGADFVVNTTTQDAQFRPSVTALADGRFVVSWSDLSQTEADTSGFAVRAHVFNADGSRSGSEFLVNTTTEGAQQLPVLAALPDGRFVAAWESVVVEFFKTDIRAQVFNPDGTRSGDEFIAGTQEGLTRVSPTIAALPDGRFAVSFVSGPAGGVPADVAVQIFDPREAAVDYGGSPLDDEFVGTRFNDRIGGNDGNDRLHGGDGDDQLFGDFGADMLDGGAGNDTVSYHESPVGVLANLNGALSLYGHAGGDTLLNVENLIGSSFGDLLVGNDNDNILYGLGGDDTLLGRAGNDTLEGGGGADRLEGSSGADSGVDTASYASSASGVTVNLATNVNTGGDAQGDSLLGIENLTGSAYGDTLTGDAKINMLSGGGGDDRLIGGAGGDTLAGGSGIDTADYSGSPAGVTVNLATGTGSGGHAQGDTLTGIENVDGSFAADTLDGNDQANMLDGGGGDDILNSGGGIDTLTGGTGNDTFYVDNAGDIVIEVAGQGADRALTFVDYTLTAGSEVEVLDAAISSATTPLNLTGNELANTIIGNAGDNIIDGGGGADMLFGNGGNDIYFVDDAGDQVFESGGEGTDRVLTSVDYTLTAGSFVETLDAAVSGATTALNLTGNERANTVIGNAGDNIINGGAGNDTLFGNGGADTFLFDTALDAASNVDVIGDFNQADDFIALDKAIFTGIATDAGHYLTGTEFHTGSAAGDADDRIIYDDTTGAVYYDSDGTGGAAQIQFATLAAGMALVNDDFIVV